MQGKKRSNKGSTKRSRNLVSLPQPRIPKDIGSGSGLSFNNAIYPRLIKLDVALAPVIISVTAGAVAQVINLQIAASPMLGTLLTIFNEYCIVGARWKIRQITTATPQGCVWVSLDEKISTTPTFALLENKAKDEIFLTTATDIDKHIVKWKALDYVDLAWYAYNVQSYPVYLKVFASNAGTLTNVATAATLLITGSMAVCFRGYQ